MGYPLRIVASEFNSQWVSHIPRFEYLYGTKIGSNLLAMACEIFFVNTGRCPMNFVVLSKSFALFYKCILY